MSRANVIKESAKNRISETENGFKVYDDRGMTYHCDTYNKALVTAVRLEKKKARRGF